LQLIYLDAQKDD